MDSTFIYCNNADKDKAHYFRKGLEDVVNRWTFQKASNSMKWSGNEKSDSGW